MLKKNLKLLKSEGWTENSEGQAVHSIESDFSEGYGKFTQKSYGIPKKQLKLLAAEYQRVAGDGDKILAHVKRVGFDDSLTVLLHHDASVTYKKAKSKAYAEYEKVKGKAHAEYEKAIGKAHAEYKKAMGKAWAGYKKAMGKAWAGYKKAKSKAYAEYEKATGKDFIKLFSKKENRRFK